MKKLFLVYSLICIIAFLPVTVSAGSDPSPEIFGSHESVPGELLQEHVLDLGDKTWILIKENDSFQSTKQHLETEIINLKHATERAQEEIQRLQQEPGRLNSLISLREEKIAFLKKQLADVNRQWISWQKSGDSGLRRVAQTQQEKELLSAQKQDFLEKRDALRSQAQGLVSGREQERQELLARMDDDNDQISRIESMPRPSNLKYKDLMDEIHDLRTTNRQLLSEIERTERSLKKASPTETWLKRSRTDVASRQVKLKASKVDDLKVGNDKIQEEIDMILRARETGGALEHPKIAALKKEINRYQSENQALAETISESRQKAEELKAQIEDGGKSVLINRLRKVTDQKIANTEERDRVKLEVEGLSSDADRIKGELQVLRDEISGSNILLETKQSNLRSLAQQIKSARRELAAAEKSARRGHRGNTIGSTVSPLGQERDSLVARKEDLETQAGLASLEKEKEDSIWRTKLDNYRRESEEQEDLTQGLVQKTTRVNEDRKQLLEEISGLIAANNRLYKQVALAEQTSGTGRKDQSADRLEQLQDLIDQKTKEKFAIEEKLAAMRMEIESAQTDQASPKSGRNEQLRQELNQYQVDNELLRAKVMDLTDMERTLKQQKAKVETLLKLLSP